MSGEGIEPDPEKVQAVAEWPRPQNLTEVRAFMALASYYRKHILCFAEIAKLLHELTKKDIQFYWATRQEQSYVMLRAVRLLICKYVLVLSLFYVFMLSYSI